MRAVDLMAWGARAVLAYACALPLAWAAAADCTLPSAALAYRVLNDDRPVGRLRIEVSRDERAIRLHTTIGIEITLLLVIPILSYRHESDELWVNGAFRRFTGVTVDNGRKYAIEIEPGGAALRLVRNGVGERVEAPLLSWAVWCAATLQSAQLLSPLKGRLKTIETRYLGEEAVRFGERSVSARRYAVVQNDRAGDVWYGPDGIVVKARFPSRHGTLVTLLRDR